MNNHVDDTYAKNKNLLSENHEFQQFPQRVKDWVIESPLASAQFSQFFRDGGTIIRRSDEPLAAYIEQVADTNLPAIRINSNYYPMANHAGQDPIEMERSLFAMLAHEIGHHAINSRSHPFTGTARQANMQYRAEHEAMTVVNAFRIFDELQQRDPAYQPGFGSVGYGDNLNVWVAYHDWQKHRDDHIVIQDLSSIVLASEDTRTKMGLDNVPDYNHDGKVTHAERYMRDWDESEKRRHNSPAAPGRGHNAGEENEQRQQRDEHLHRSPQPQAVLTPTQEFRFFPRTPEDDYLDAFLDAAERGDYAARQSLTEQYEQLPHVQAQLQKDREDFLAEQQRLLEEQLRREQVERERSMQQERERSHSRGFSR